MSQVVTLDSTVAARTRAAAQILATPALLSTYEARGGIPEDLQSIRDQGLTAEALSQATFGGAATLAVLGPFVALQKEYAAILGVVQAVHHDLVRANAPAEVRSAVDEILANEAEMPSKTRIEKPGKARKKASKSVNPAALLATIAGHARALLNVASIHNALDRRKVNRPRLEQVILVAESLSNKMTGHAGARGEETTATAALGSAIDEQTRVWSACSRILAAAGNDDVRVALLLSNAAPPRSKSKKARTKQR
ncbi:MAG: hypothetical protein ABJE95_37675 [Byssovorax sp.]